MPYKKYGTVRVLVNPTDAEKAMFARVFSGVAAGGLSARAILSGAKSITATPVEPEPEQLGAPIDEQPDKEPITIAIGDNYSRELRQRLDSNGIPLGELAREMGIDRSQLARMFNKNIDPRLSTVIRTERAFQQILRKRE
jgi:AraC-like DNA-binding protein